MSVPLNSGHGEKTLSLCLFLFQAEEFEKTRTPKRTWWKYFKIVVTTLTILLSVIAILLSTHVIPTWPSLPPGTNKTVPWNQSPASGILNSPGGELEDELLPDPWRKASSRFLSSVCTSTSLAQLCYCSTSSSDAGAFTPSTQEAKVGRCKSRPPIYTKNLLKTAWWLMLVIPILRKQDCCEFKATPRYIACSRSNWSYSELFQKVSIFKKHKHCKLYYNFCKSSTLPRITCVSRTSHTLSCSSPGGRYQTHRGNHLMSSISSGLLN